MILLDEIAEVIGVSQFTCFSNVSFFERVQRLFSCQTICDLLFFALKKKVLQGEANCVVPIAPDGPGLPVMSHKLLMRYRRR
jgi:hypothetical protein